MNAAAKSHEFLVGLHVTDDEVYRRYREAMTPLLEACGGYFRYDFKVGETLKSETDERINRVFVISFPDAQTGEAFFTGEEYLGIKRAFFEPSVGATTIIAKYDRALGA